MGALSSVDIMEAVEKGLNRLYPGEPVYWDYLPKDFKRPCFALECPRTAGTDLNAALVRREADILVTCMVKTDAYGDSSRKELTRRQMTLLGLFLPGYIRVKDRAPRVLDQGEMDNGMDFAAVTVTLSYTLIRQDFMQLRQPPDMGALHIKQEVTTHG